MKRLLFFTQASCAPCQFFKPIVRAAAAETGLDLREIDAQAEPGEVDRLGVTKTPTLLLMDGDAEVRRWTAPTPKARLIAELA